MKFSAVSLLILSATISLSSALEHPFLGRGKPDQRAPCPFLNTMANHGILNHNGTDITMDQLSAALKYAGLTDSAAKAFVSAVPKALPHVATDKKFNLNELNEKHKGDHDVSLTRYDILTETHQFGDNRPAGDLVDGMLAVNPNTNQITYQDLILWRQQRHAQEKERHAGGEPVDFGARPQFLSAGECALLLNVFGTEGVLNKESAHTILMNERLPNNWSPNKNIGIKELGVGIVKCGVGYWMPSRLVRWLFSSASSNEGGEEGEGSSNNEESGWANAWKGYQRALGGESIEDSMV